MNIRINTCIKTGIDARANRGGVGSLRNAKHALRGALIALGLTLVQAAFAAEPLRVVDWAARTGPLYPHSAIVEGETELGLIDVQQAKSEAHRLVADLLEKGKSLSWVYVTHPHLDHFAGANIIRAAFPNAKFYGPSAHMNAEMARQVRTRRLALGQGTPGGAYNLPETAPDYFQAAPEEGLRLDGQSVEILRGRGDHPDSSVVWVPSARTIVAGDVIFNRTHAFFGDHDDLQGWIELVERAVKLRPAVVVAAHSATLNPPGEIASQQLAWLKDLQSGMTRHRDPAEVKREMVAKYPGYANDFIFEFSYGVIEARKRNPAP